MEASPAWLQTFLDRLAADDLAAASRRGYRYDLLHFIAWYTTMIRDEDLVHVWPLQRRHITPNGVYFANRILPAFVLPDPVEA